MASEYEPKMDGHKTVPVLPRPLRRVDQRIRATNLTGDPSGQSPTDDMMFWQGLDKGTQNRIMNTEVARYFRGQALAALWSSTDADDSLSPPPPRPAV